MSYKFYETAMKCTFIPAHVIKYFNFKRWGDPTFTVVTTKKHIPKKVAAFFSMFALITNFFVLTMFSLPTFLVGKTLNVKDSLARPLLACSQYLDFLDGVDPGIECRRNFLVKRLAAAKPVHLGAQRGHPGVLTKMVNDKTVNSGRVWGKPRNRSAEIFLRMHNLSTLE